MSEQEKERAGQEPGPDFGWVCEFCGRDQDGGYRPFANSVQCVECHNEMEYCPKCTMLYVPRHADRHDCQKALAAFAEYEKQQAEWQRQAAEQEERRRRDREQENNEGSAG